MLAIVFSVKVQFTGKKYRYNTSTSFSKSIKAQNMFFRLLFISTNIEYKTKM